MVVPVLLDRSDAWSANPALGKATNLPHREFLWRMAFEVGRHPIGFEVQKVLALVDLFASQGGGRRWGVYGYAEGGLLALHAGALDPRLGAVAVSGHFRNRRQVWREPVYRDVWGLLRGYGDAELAALVQPRLLVVEAVPGPTVTGPPPQRPRESPGRSWRPGRVAAGRGAGGGGLGAPGLRGPRRCRQSGAGRARGGRAEGICGTRHRRRLRAFLAGLGVALAALDRTGQPPPGTSPGFDPAPRPRRQGLGPALRLHPGPDPALRARARRLLVGRGRLLPGSLATHLRAVPGLPLGGGDRRAGPQPALNARTRRLSEQEAWTSYEVVLDVWPDVFAYGLLRAEGPHGPARGGRWSSASTDWKGRPQTCRSPDDRPTTTSPPAWPSGATSSTPHRIPYIGGEDRFRCCSARRTR